MQKAALIVTLFVMGGILGGIIYAYVRSSQPPPERIPASATDRKPLAIDTPVPTAVQSQTLDLTRLRLGDGNSSDTPKKGAVFSCRRSFPAPKHTSVPWINGATWNAKEKPFKQSSVSWPKATLDIHILGAVRFIIGNGLPYGTQTGAFPLSPQSLSFRLTADPREAATPTCVPADGIVGMTVNGVPIYSAITAEGQDAVAHEELDSCGGHTDADGLYHYHGPNACISQMKGNNTLVGYALDGYGIYSQYGQDGRERTNADLDACHGTTDEVPWDGRTVRMYHYVMTREYPYSVGCFRGTPIQILPKDTPVPATPSATVAPTETPTPTPKPTALPTAQSTP